MWSKNESCLIDWVVDRFQDSFQIFLWQLGSHLKRKGNKTYPTIDDEMLQIPVESEIAKKKERRGSGLSLLKIEDGILGYLRRSLTMGFEFLQQRF